MCLTNIVVVEQSSETVRNFTKKTSALSLASFIMFFVLFFFLEEKDKSFKILMGELKIYRVFN